MTLLVLMTTPALASERSESGNVNATGKFRVPTRLLVSVADGIDRKEAELIGQAYFKRHVGCGTFDGISDRGGRHWRVEGKFGYAGDEIRDFTIDKLTGKITSSIGPSYPDPDALLGFDFASDIAITRSTSPHE